MKKKLEAELISIAHRILKLTNKSDINQLYLETQKLYEKLAILKFVDDNFDTAKPTIGRNEMHAQIEEAFENEAIVPQIMAQEEPKLIEAEAEEPISNEIIALEPTEEIAAKEDIFELPIAELSALSPEDQEETTVSQPLFEEEVFEEEEEEFIIKEAEKKAIEMVTETSFSSFTPSFEIDEEIEEIEEEIEIEEKQEPVEIEEPKIAPKPQAVQISFEDLMGINYSEAQFVKVDEVEFVSPTKKTDFQEKIAAPEVAVLEKTEPKPMSLNEKLAKGIHIDLNDRLAFTKHLFGNSSEDYNRVLNQLITFDTFGETKLFIEEMVKPDYNNWEGKEDYAHRFMEILEKKFL